MPFSANDNRGFTLVEVVLVLILISIIVSVAVRQMAGSIDTAKYEHTRLELDMLAAAIAGDPMIYDGGTRTDFGYVGDNGALPPNLAALVTDPGLGTWDGPYINRGTNDNDYATDAWGRAYILRNRMIRSRGSGSRIDKEFAASRNALLRNTVEGVIRDAAMNPPGGMYRDSVRAILRHPDGSGSLVSSSARPTRDGYFRFRRVPVGIHDLLVVYLPKADTTTRSVTVEPGSIVRLDITHPLALF